MVPYIYWNNRGEFKRQPRFCATGVNYGADWLVDSKGNTKRRADEHNYLLGKLKPRYPLPTKKQSVGEG